VDVVAATEAAAAAVVAVSGAVDGAYNAVSDPAPPAQTAPDVLEREPALFLDAQFCLLLTQL